MQIAIVYMKRYIVFDTETTGLDPINGDRLIEIGAVELLDKKRSGRTYHQYINPEQKIPEEVVNLTHITDDMLSGKPVFAEMADDFLSFLKFENEDVNSINNNNTSNDIEETYLVAHNASFDIKFLNYQLKLIGKENGISEFNVIDTIDIARRKFPRQKASLDILCEKLGISLEKRKKEGHGALLDAQILVDVFISLTSGDNSMISCENALDFNGFTKRNEQLKSRNFKLEKEEIEEHENFLKENGIDNF